jgi:hypothetical protein
MSNFFIFPTLTCKNNQQKWRLYLIDAALFSKYIGNFMLTLAEVTLSFERSKLFKKNYAS